MQHFTAVEQSLVGIEAEHFKVADNGNAGLVKDIEKPAALGLIESHLAHEGMATSVASNVVTEGVDSDARNSGGQESKLEISRRRHEAGQMTPLALILGACPDQHLDAFARARRGSVEEKVGSLRIVFLEHLRVLSETTGGYHGRLGVYGQFEARFAVIGTQSHGFDAPDGGARLILDKLSALRHVIHLAHALNTPGQRHHGVARSAHVASRSKVVASARHHCALEIAQAVKAHAHVEQPSVHVVAAAIGRRHEGGFSFIAVKLRVNHGCPMGTLALIGGITRSNAAIKVEVQDIGGLSNGETRVRHGHGATGNSTLLNDGNRIAHINQLSRAHNASGTRTHNDHVNVDCLFALIFRLNNRSRERVKVIARLLDGFGHSRHNRTARDGAATHRGNVHALVRNNGSRNASACIAADANRLGMRKNLTANNGTVAQGCTNIDVVLMAHSLGNVLAIPTSNLAALFSLLLSESNGGNACAHCCSCTQERTTSHRKRFHYRTPLLLMPCRIGTSRRNLFPLPPNLSRRMSPRVSISKWLQLKATN